jgi:N-acetylglucosamine-6-sulfatase
MEPYQTTPNNVVMSTNGKHPTAYVGYHQTDIVRAKALDRLDTLIAGEEPFFLFLSPTAPHVDDETRKTVPLARHMEMFPNITAPRLPNYNPSDEVHANSAGWIKNLAAMDEGNVTWTDLEYRLRAQSLQGIDEILADVIKKLEDENVIDNTYIVFSSDNGYHLGNHRMTAGKATAFIEDTNLPFVVRGPGITPGSKTTVPSSFIDMAPTFLEIAGVDKEDFPSFLDGRSLFSQWKDPESACNEGTGKGNNYEVLNIEYWGSNGVFVPSGPTTQNATYKSLRIVGSEFAYLYTHWCYSNEVELYNTIDDPYELKNLARNPDEETQKLLHRMNAMLLVQKSCTTNVCQNPWTVLLANTSLPAVTTLKDSLDPIYDEHFASFPQVNIKACLGFQSTENEFPFYPLGAEELLYENKESTALLGPSSKFTPMVPENDPPAGGEDQRYVTIEEIMAASRLLTEEELDRNQKRGTTSSGRMY